MKLAQVKPRESDHQKLAVDYVRKRGLGDYLVMIPNGVHLAGAPGRRARYMASLKKQGLQPGASDLFFAKPILTSNLWHHGAWFEMKRGKNEPVSIDQKKFLARMRQAGYYVDVCRGFDEFQVSFDRYLRGLPSPCDSSP